MALIRPRVCAGICACVTRKTPRQVFSRRGQIRSTLHKVHTVLFLRLCDAYFDGEFFKQNGNINVVLRYD